METSRRINRVLKATLVISTICLILLGVGLGGALGWKSFSADQAAALICFQALLAVAVIGSSGSPQSTGQGGGHQTGLGPAHRASAFFLLLIFLSLLCLSILSYSSAFRGDFLFDDYIYLEHSDSLSLSIHRFTFRGVFIRPLVAFFWCLDRRLWGMEPFGFHLTNILIHAGCAWLVFCLGLKFFRKRWPAFIAGALFALHPVQVEAVYWISARFDLVCAFFYLASVNAYLVFRERNGRLWICVSLAAALLALLSKEMALTLPLILFMAEALLPAGSPDSSEQEDSPLRGTARRLVPHIILVAVYICLRLVFYGGIGGYSGAVELKESIFGLALLRSIFLYVPRGLFLPVNQSAALWFPSFQGAMMVIGALAFCFFGFESRADIRKLLYGLVWIAITMIPVVSIYNLENTMQTSRYLYLPAAGFAFFMAGIFSGPARRKISRILCALIALAVLAFCMIGARVNLAPWDDASQIARKIRAEILSSISFEKGRLKIYIKGVPWDIHGVVVFGDALPPALRASLHSRKAGGELIGLGPLSVSVTHSAGTRQVSEHIFIAPNTEALDDFDRIFYRDEGAGDNGRLIDLTQKIKAALDRRLAENFSEIEFSRADLIPVNDISATPSSAYVAHGSDPSLHTHHFQIDPAGYIAMELVMRVSPIKQSPAPLYGELFWRHRGSAGFDAERRLNFFLQPDNKIHTYRIDLKNEVLWLWDGPVVQLRLDPGDAPARYEIFRFRLIKASGDDSRR